jgi:hypothetical protein
MDCLPQLHLAAIHGEAGYRGNTHGLGVFCRLGPENEAWATGIGRFRNSVAGYSNYALVGYQPYKLAGVRLGAFAGTMNGYVYKNGGYFPAAGGLASIPVPFGELHVVGIPKNPYTPATLEFSITVRF